VNNIYLKNYSQSGAVNVLKLTVSLSVLKVIKRQYVNYIKPQGYYAKYPDAFFAFFLLGGKYYIVLNDEIIRISEIKSVSFINGFLCRTILIDHKNGKETVFKYVRFFRLLLSPLYLFNMDDWWGLSHDLASQFEGLWRMGKIEDYLKNIPSVFSFFYNIPSYDTYQKIEKHCTDLCNILCQEKFDASKVSPMGISIIFVEKLDDFLNDKCYIGNIFLDKKGIYSSINILIPGSFACEDDSLMIRRFIIDQFLNSVRLIADKRGNEKSVLNYESLYSMLIDIKKQYLEEFYV